MSALFFLDLMGKHVQTVHAFIHGHINLSLFIHYLGHPVSKIYFQQRSKSYACSITQIVYMYSVYVPLDIYQVSMLECSFKLYIPIRAPGYSQCPYQSALLCQVSTSECHLRLCAPIRMLLYVRRPHKSAYLLFVPSEFLFTSDVLISVPPYVTLCQVSPSSHPLSLCAPFRMPLYVRFPHQSAS